VADRPVYLRRSIWPAAPVSTTSVGAIRLPVESYRSKSRSTPVAGRVSSSRKPVAFVGAMYQSSSKAHLRWKDGDVVSSSGLPASRESLGSRPVSLQAGSAVLVPFSASFGTAAASTTGVSMLPS
jgi:hypothetical protein